MDNSKNVLGTESIGKLIVKYSVPAIIGMMVNALYNVVDRIFIGNIPDAGPMAITGLGVTLPITTIIMAFGTLVGIGATTNISIRLGEGKIEEAKKNLGNAITLSVIIGIVLAIIGMAFLDNILMLFGASEGTLIYAKSYTSIILIGTVFSLMAMMFSNLIRGDGNPKLSAMIMAIGCLTNIILDAIFIFGFNMGIQGAALATIIAQGITAIWGLLYYIKGKSNVKFEKSTLKLNKNIVIAMFAIGSAPFAMQLANSLVQVTVNNSLKLYGGDLAIGAMATINSITMIFVMPAFGFVQAMQPIVGFNYGAKKYDRAKEAFKITLVLTTVVLVIGAMFVQLAPQVLVGMFNKDAELMNITINGLRKYLFALPIIGLSIVGTNYIQSTGNAKIAMILGLLRQVILLIPLAIILPKFVGLDGVWYAQPVADILSCVITVVILIKELNKFSNNTELEYDEKIEIA
ncbi:MAG: MATE family efflux transporter [Paraclostridium sp.]